MANYLVAKCGNTTSSYSLRSTEPSKPYLRVSNSYLPLTTQTKTGLQVKVNDNNYNIQESYTTTTTYSYTSKNSTEFVGYAGVYNSYRASTRTYHPSYGYGNIGSFSASNPYNNQIYSIQYTRAYHELSSTYYTEATMYTTVGARRTTTTYSKWIGEGCIPESYTHGFLLFLNIARTRIDYKNTVYYRDRITYTANSITYSLPNNYSSLDYNNTFTTNWLNIYSSRSDNMTTYYTYDYYGISFTRLLYMTIRSTTCYGTSTITVQ